MDKDAFRNMIADYMKPVPCPLCGAPILSGEPEIVGVDGKLMMVCLDCANTFPRGD